MGFFRSPNQPTQPTELNNIRVTQSILNTALPLAYGTVRVQGKMLWTGDFHAVQGQTQSGGGKGFGGGGGSSSYYDYFCAAQFALCSGPIGGIRNIWDSNGRFTQSTVGEGYTVGSPYTHVVQMGGVYGTDNGVTYQTPYSYSVNDYVDGSSANPNYNSYVLSGDNTAYLDYTPSPTPGPASTTWTRRRAPTRSTLPRTGSR